MTVAIDKPAESGSNRPGAGSRDSGSSRVPATRNTATTGTLTRNTEPHQKCSSSAPPTSGPSARPPPEPADQMAMALVRSRASGNRLRMIDSVEGMIVAPATPSSTRAAISVPALGEKAASAEAIPNAAVPMSSTFFRPKRSAMVPAGTSSPARVSE